MAAGYIYLRGLLAVTLLHSWVQGNLIQVGLSLVPDADTVIAQKASPLLLNCSVHLDPETGEPSFQWQKDGALLDFTNKDSHRLQLHSNGSLFFRRVIHRTGRKRKWVHSDEGVYECLVTTKHGQAIARRVTVRVASIDRKFSQEPAAFEAYEGGVARFQCTIHAVPTPIVLWQKDQTSLPQDNPTKYNELPSGILHIRNASKGDEGRYRCLASHGGLHNLPDMVDAISWEDSSEAMLTVKPALTNPSPRVIGAPKDLTLVAGKSGYMECLVDGNPIPSTSWHRGDGKPLQKDHVVEEPGALHFIDVTEADAAVYICSVGGASFANLTAILTVHTPPEVVEKTPRSQKWTLTRTVRFDCDVTGNPKPRISWYHNGNEVIDGMARINVKPKQLILRNTVAGDSGYYQCFAENSAGSLSLIARLNMYRKDGTPETPQNLSGVATSSTSINLQWYQPQSPGQFPIITNTIWFAKGNSPLDTKFVEGEGPWYNNTLTNLEPFTNYSVFIRSFNRMGSSENSDPVTVQTLEERPVEAAQVVLTNPETETLLATWQPPPPHFVRGQVQHYRLIYKEFPDGVELEVPELPATQTSYLISGLKHETEYGVLVLPATKAGYPDINKINWEWARIKTGGKCV